MKGIELQIMRRQVNVGKSVERYPTLRKDLEAASPAVTGRRILL